MDYSHKDYNTESSVAQYADFKIDPEFANKIPPIGADEFRQLRENILAAGEVYEPLVVWNGVLVDGHNRWNVIQENPSIKYKVREMDFPDKWAAFEWMYKNQLGRRNLTDEQRTYTIGKMYEARKRSNGGTGANQYTSAKEQLTQNGKAANHKQGTAGEIAREMGMGNNTVIRAEKFANGVDALREINPEAANKVLSGKAKVTKSTVSEIAKMEPDDVEAAADAILADMAIEMPKQDTQKPEPPKPKKKTGYNAADRELYRMIDEAYKPMLDESAQVAYTVEDLADDIAANGFDFVNYLNGEMERRNDLLKSNAEREVIRKAIEDVLEAIGKVCVKL